MDPYPEYRGIAGKSAIKAFLPLLGPVGTMLDVVLFGIGDQVKTNRLEMFAKELESRISNLEEVLETNYGKSEDFYDLTVKALSVMIKTKYREKMELLATVYGDAIVNQYSLEDNFTEVLLGCVDDLSPNHLITFKFIVENIDSYKKLSSYERLYEGFAKRCNQPDLDKYEFRMYLRDIEAKTLIQFSTGIREYSSSGGYIATEDYEKTDAIILTSIGKSLIDLMER